MHLYVALLELKVGQQSVLLEDIGPGVVGAAVRAYVVAHSPDRARAEIAVAVAELDCSIVEVEWLVRNDEVEWENPDSPEALELGVLARDRGEVEFGEFHVWE